MTRTPFQPLVSRLKGEQGSFFGQPVGQTIKSEGAIEGGLATGHPCFQLQLCIGEPWIGSRMPDGITSTAVRKHLRTPRSWFGHAVISLWLSLNGGLNGRFGEMKSLSNLGRRVAQRLGSHNHSTFIRCQFTLTRLVTTYGSQWSMGHDEMMRWKLVGWWVENTKITGRVANFWRGTIQSLYHDDTW